MLQIIFKYFMNVEELYLVEIRKESRGQMPDIRKL